MFRKLKRRVEKKTDYRQRLGLLKSGKIRLVARRSLTGIKAQLVKYEPSGDKVMVSAMTKELASYGWLGGFDIPAAYLTGFLLAKKAKEKGIIQAVLDIGLQLSTKGNKTYAFAKGCVDGGIEISLGEEIVPDSDRIKGKHIEDYAKKLKKESPAVYEKRFSSYLKKGMNPEEITKHFETVKNNISGKFPK